MPLGCESSAFEPLLDHARVVPEMPAVGRAEDVAGVGLVAADEQHAVVHDHAGRDRGVGAVELVPFGVGGGGEGQQQEAG